MRFFLYLVSVRFIPRHRGASIVQVSLVIGARNDDELILLDVQGGWRGGRRDDLLLLGGHSCLLRCGRERERVDIEASGRTHTLAGWSNLIVNVDA